MTQKQLEDIQKKISEEMARIVVKNCVPKRVEKLEELNVMLDSINRAAYYLMKEEK